MGQVHLKYTMGHKRLFIEVYPSSDPRLAIRTTVRSPEGKTVERNTHLITSLEDLTAEAKWLAEPRV
jgi:hypothetical protein